MLRRRPQPLRRSLRPRRPHPQLSLRAGLLGPRNQAVPHLARLDIARGRRLRVTLLVQPLRALMDRPLPALRGRRLPIVVEPQPVVQDQVRTELAEIREPVDVRKGALPAAVLAAVEERLREGRVMPA
jgi:hypothetical protein